MKLRKQLFAAFLSVAMLPLIGVGIYMLASNLMLSFNLYEQNLRDSAEIQAGLLEENINQLMVRAGRFASARTVKEACMAGSSESLNAEELSKDILNFTDETLDNVAIFALADGDGALLYSSGSNSDSTLLTELLPQVKVGEEQAVHELFFGERGGSLLLVTPVKENMRVVGSFLVVCRTDYFLRLISGNQQIEATNALIYCKDHERTVVSKLDAPAELPELDEALAQSMRGSVICRTNQWREMVYFREISKTPWVLATIIPVGQIFSQVWGFGLINLAALLLVLVIILYLSRRQSRKMLRPLEQLLDSVELFFVSDAKEYQKPALDAETEIGYLAEKFSGMSKEASRVQGRLRESTYLYHSLLQATYEFRMIIDLPTDTIHCTLEPLATQLSNRAEQSAPERVLAFLCETHIPEALDTLEEITSGRCSEPVEIEVCCDMGKHREETWYHLVAVPISGDSGAVEKVVLHFEDVTQEKHEEFRLIRSSQTDPLCGLLNKTAFPLHCRMSEPGKTDAVFFIDLDAFKLINDTLGHAAGDEILIAAADTIRDLFRSGDAIGRFGGDEFVVFAPGISRKLAEQKADVLVKALSFFRSGPMTQLHVTASVGVCIAAKPMELAQAIQLADEAMYRAKEHGKSQYFIG